MAKGQLHSTGTICKAEIRCPIEAEGGQHFDSVDELIDHTAAETGAPAAEIRSVIASGVGPAEAVSMAKEGFLGRSMPQSLSREPKIPATITIDLSSVSSDELSKKFLSNLRESIPVNSVKGDGTGSYTIIVDAESDPSDYSVLMAASTAAENAASEMGYDEEEMEDFSNALSISASLNLATRESSAPLKPAQVKELDQFDPAVHSVFSNATARKEPSIAARALKREVANGEWMEELAERHREEIANGEEAPLYGDSETKMIESRARQAAMAREMHWLSENDPSYKAKLPAGVSALLRTVQGNSHSGVPIGLVKKAS